MIIVEGCDASGKSTLILRLANEFNLPVLRSFKPDTQSDIYSLTNWASASPKPIIMDRHSAFSELIYGETLRGHSLSHKRIAKSVRANNFLIYCDPTLPVILKHLGDEEQMDGVEDSIAPLYSAYNELMSELEPDFTYDWTNHRSYQALVTNLTHYLERSK